MRLERPDLGFLAHSKMILVELQILVLVLHSGQYRNGFGSGGVFCNGIFLNFEAAALNVKRLDLGLPVIYPPIR